MDVVTKLKEISLFQGIAGDTSSMEQILHAMEEKGVSKGETIVREGEKGCEMYILLEGSVTVQKRTLQGDQYVVARLTEDDGAFFGEMALVGYEDRSATVMADSACRLFVLTKERFDELASKNTKLGFEVVRTIAKRMAEQLRRANYDMMVLFEALLSEVGADSSLEA